MSEAAQSEPRKPRVPWLAPLLLPALKRIAARRSEQGDEKSTGIGPFWIHVYRWGARSYGTGRWYEDWHVLVGWPGGHRSFHVLDAPEPEAPE